MDEQLKQELKSEALELAEGITTELITHVFNFARNTLSKSDNKILTAIVPILNTVEEYLLSLADKIDGVENNV